MPQLSLRASFEPATIDVEKRTVELTWTTGSRVLRGFFEPYFEELSLDPKHVRMGRLQSGAAPLLAAHRSFDLADVIGVVESATLDGKRGTATVRFDSGPEGEDAFRKVREGILKNVSVGYAVHRMQKIEDGDSTRPVYRAIDWEPHEISMVPIGADAGAVTRSAGGNPCEFIQERAMPDETETDTETDTETNDECECEGEEDCDCEESSDEGAERKADADADADAGERSVTPTEIERARILGIQRVGRALKRPDAEVIEAIKKGTKLDKYRATAQDAFAKEGTITVEKRSTASMIQAGDDAHDKFMRCAEHLIFQRAGVASMITADAAKRGEKLTIDPGICRGLTMAELAREFLERAGTKTRGMDKMEMVGKAFMQRTASSTSDFPVLLENALHKTLLAAYGTTPDTWRRWCKVGSVSDFRPHNRYRQGSFGVLSTVLEGGEFKNSAIPDGEKETISATTKGRIVGITRQAIINDDMGAFNDIATRLGRAAALTIELDAYALLVANPTMGDGIALFHASHNNITTSAVLSAANLDLDRVAMGIQTESEGNEVLDLSPEILLVAKSLGGQARVINDSAYDPDTLANKSHMKPNIAGKMFKDIVDTARLSGTTRYLLADPAIAPVVEVAFLNGVEAPYMEMQQGWRTDGTEWKIRLDFGVGAVDWRGAIRNAGA
jgi:phage head maturation protease